MFNEFPYIFYFLTNADYTSTIFLLCLSDIKCGKRINEFSYITNSTIEKSIKRKIIEGILSYGTQTEENEADLWEMIDHILKPKNFSPHNLLTALERDLSYLKSL